MPLNQQVVNATPFLKWAGGKSQLIKQYQPYFPPRSSINNYYEPFIGSAAVFFYLQPVNSHLSDINPKLVNVYQVVRDNVEELISSLKQHKNQEAYYYQVRGLEPNQLSRVEQAARIIYLNKTCYNGLYRENKQGRFNVPFGRYKNPKICDEERLRRASDALQSINLRVVDFEEGVSKAGSGDFVYFDPPYAPISTTSKFTSYSKHAFQEAEQRRLAKVIDQLSARKCKVMLSNSSAPLIKELYPADKYLLVEIRSRRNINSKADSRGPITELLILNHEVEL